MRKTLNKLPVAEGIIFAMEDLNDYGTFMAMDSWAGSGKKEEKVLLVRFEDMTSSDQFTTFRKIFDHCDIGIPDKGLKEILVKYSFKKLSGGRSKGKEDPQSHYRKGTAGDWVNHFDRVVENRFRELTGELTKRLGYE